MMEPEAEGQEALAQILQDLGIADADHPALKDRASLGRYLVALRPPERGGDQYHMSEWMNKRRILSHAGVEQLRAALEAHPPRRDASPTASQGILTPAPEAGGGGESDLEDQPHEMPNWQELSLSDIADRAPVALQETIQRMDSLEQQNRYPEAFREGVQAFDQACEESVLDACLHVGMMAGRWDRKMRIAPYFLHDAFEELAAAFGKHVREMRHIDPDPLRATSGMYRLATKIYFAWVDHCAAVLEHQHRRTNTAWIQMEWIPPHRFNCLLSIMRSAVRIKLPLDLLQRIYNRIRAVVRIGKEAISIDTKKIKFEGDCLRILASPTKDVIPDLCYQIYRDIIDVYVKAGENASAIMFCDQALLIRRGDHEVEQIKAAVIAQSGRQQRGGPHARDSYRISY